MAGQFTGRRVSVGLGKEATRGTGVAPTEWAPHTSLSFDDKAEKADLTDAMGVIDDSNETRLVSKWGEGSIEGNVRGDSFGLILYAMMGAISSAVIETTAYQHTFTESQTNNHQSLTIVAADPIGSSRFVNAVLNSLEIKVDINAVVTYTAEFMSKTSKGTTATASFSAEPVFTSTMACMKLADAVGGLTAATTIPLKGFSITFTKNVLKNDVTCTNEPEDFFNQDFMVEGEFSLDLTDRTYREYMRANTYQALRMAIQDNGTTIGATSHPLLQIDLSRVDFRGWEADRPIDGISTQSVSFKGHTDIANSLDIVNSILLNNTTTSY